VSLELLDRPTLCLLGWVSLRGWRKKGWGRRRRFAVKKPSWGSEPRRKLAMLGRLPQNDDGREGEGGKPTLQWTVRTSRSWFCFKVGEKRRTWEGPHRSAENRRTSAGLKGWGMGLWEDTELKTTSLARPPALVSGGGAEAEP